MNYHFVDRVLFLDVKGEGRIETLKAFPRTEDYLDDIFRSPSVVPSSLLLETMASSGALLISACYHYNVHALLLKIEEVRFFNAVHSGDRVLVRSQLLGVHGEVAKTVGEALVGETKVAEARLLFLHVPWDRTIGRGKESFILRVLEWLGLERTPTS
ncbi:MAG: hypothetical protein HY347_00700 [candidate division NC10 bacterium]|nr:hypothetical protein [candidate division NC10 bacterium]